VEIDYSDIKVIGFDADDTLWVNETYFRDAEIEFAKLMAPYETANKVDQELFKMEIKNLSLYGYGVKGFVLSMVEMALELSNGAVPNQTIEKILDIGKDMINKPVELLDGVEEVLQELNGKYRMIVATKGDLLDQERKLLSHLDINPNEFLMVGNSLKSDILPLVNIGAHAIHIPFHTTWAHEQVSSKETNGKKYKTLKGLLDILKVLK